MYKITTADSPFAELMLLAANGEPVVNDSSGRGNPWEIIVRRLDILRSAAWKRATPEERFTLALTDIRYANARRRILEHANTAEAEPWDNSKPATPMPADLADETKDLNGRLEDAFVGYYTVMLKNSKRTPAIDSNEQDYLTYLDFLANQRAA